MRWTSACSLLGSLVAVVALAPRAAQANSCLPTVGPLAPADGAELAVNARPLATADCGGDLSGWEVEIDGEPGALLLQAPGYGYGILTSIGIDPAPAEGARVEIWGCSEGCWDPSVERDVMRSYVMGAEDISPPARPELVGLEFEDEIITQWDFETGRDELVAVRRWTVRFEPPADESPVAWEVEVGPSRSSVASKTARIMGELDDQIVLLRFDDDAGQEVCAVARAMDLAGNASAIGQVCVQVGEDQTLPEVPGGGDDGDAEDPTDTGADDGSEDGGSTDDLDLDEAATLDETRRGCSIAGGRGLGGAGAWMLALLVLGMRRRLEG